MKKVDEMASELSDGELTVKAAMEAEVFGEGKNVDFTLTVARLALLLHRGGRGEDSIAAG